MDLVFEIGTEELPASFQLPAVQFIAAEIAARFPEAKLRTFATPRRLAVIASGLSEGSKDESKQVVGPPASSPAKAREGFARKAGVPLESLREENGRLVATVVTKGVATAEVLPGLLENIIHSIPFRKSMRWDSLDGDAFARPVHWIGAALDGKQLQVRFADVISNNSTRGHRFHAPEEFMLPRADQYEAALRERHVIASWEERKKAVKAEVARAAHEAGGVPRDDAELYETVTGLVEEPSAVVGRFDKEFLELPPEVLVSEMRGHLKYFAVQDDKGNLLPAFVAVSNTRVRDPAVTRQGYERAIGPRLADGKFFFDEDRKTPLRERVEKLSRRTFLAGLGTELDRANRLRELALWLHGATGRGDPAALSEAAELCKADLTTGMVGEFPELQGSMGRVYALHDGCSREVADAIFEHYLPRGAEDKLPPGDTGALLGLADRIDQLVGIFGIGKEPTGTADPYGQRRAALGLLRVTLAKQYRFDLREALEHAQRLHSRNEKVSREKALIDKIWAFLMGRLEVLLKDSAQPDSVAAVLHTGARDLVALSKRVSALQTVREKNRAQFEATAAAFKRIANILAQAAEKKIAPVGLVTALAKSDGEQKLLAALAQSREKVSGALAEREDYPAAYAALAELRPSVDAFFDGVMVMDPDPAQRDNRLALLRALHELFSPLADFSKVQVGGGGSADDGRRP
jgi:glycyl-tRNA synthetase beta chain